VFCWLSDEDRLGDVYLVCRQWRDLVRRSESWRDAKVQLDGLVEVMQFQRLVPRVIGAIRNLHINLYLIGEAHDHPLDIVSSELNTLLQRASVQLEVLHVGFGGLRRSKEEHCWIPPLHLLGLQHLSIEGGRLDHLGVGTFPRLHTLTAKFVQLPNGWRVPAAIKTLSFVGSSGNDLDLAPEHLCSCGDWLGFVYS
jgi:hypothetical protein